MIAVPAMNAPRREALEKVSGEAMYTGDVQLPGMLHALAVHSTVARGRLVNIDVSRAERAPGVRLVLTHRNAPKLGEARVLLDGKPDGNLHAGGAGQHFMPLQGDRIHYSGQHIAFVIADTWEQASAAAELLEVSYDAEPPLMDFERARSEAVVPEEVWGRPADITRGDVESGLRTAEVVIDAEYVTCMQHHNTMELHATVAHWEGDCLTIYEPSTWVFGVRQTFAQWFRIPEENIRVRQWFVGGSFGAKGPTWPHAALIAAAARMLNRPVRIELTRRQTFTSNGYRPEIHQRIRLGVNKDGVFSALRHDVMVCSAVFDNRVVAPVTRTARKLYSCANVTTTYRLGKLSLPGPFTFRGPGESPGQFALESAIDEAAWALRMDPIDLRLRNEPDVDPETELPWSSRSLRECFRQGAERFGWSRRTPEPGSMRDGEYLIGMGVATMAYDARVSPAKAKLSLFLDGSVLVQSATCDQGTGCFTILPEIAAGILGLDPASVRCELGDTTLPFAPISAGSQTTASVGSAVRDGAIALLREMRHLAVTDPMSPLYGRNPEHLTPHKGFLHDDAGVPDALADLLDRNGLDHLEAAGSVEPTEEHRKHSCYSFGAQFAEVAIHRRLGEIRVTRFTGAYGVGRVVNPKLAHAQLIGGIVWGIGMALMEQTVVDRRHGRMLNTNLADYHVPVNADIHNIDAFFVQEKDTAVNPLGTKSVGEIGTIAAAPAIANAVFHATGKRIRHLPITIDKLL